MALSFSAHERQQAKGDLLKKRLVDVLSSERTEFLKVADEFYAQEERTAQSYITFCEAVIAAVDQVIDAGDWDDSLFLRNTIKPLKAIRKEALQLLDELNGKAVNDHVITEVSVAPDQVKLYILLFQNNGYDIKQWEMQLRSIDTYLQGRPVYEQEADVEKVVRQKKSQGNDGYIVVVAPRLAVHSDPFAMPRTDRYGNTLLTLKPGKIGVQHIIEFVHQDQRYRFVDGKLLSR